MKILICDDDLMFAQAVHDRLLEFCSGAGISASVIVHSSAENIPPELLPKFDIAFLDIDMKPTDGFTLARNIHNAQPNTIIIFLTNYPQFAAEGYEVQAFRYLLKTKLDQKLIPYFQAAVEQFRSIRKTVSFTLSGEETDIPVSDILYIESAQRTVFLHLTQPSRLQPKLYATLNAMEDQFRPLGFLRIQKSYLVNMAHIRKFQYNTVTLSNGQILTVSEKHYTKLKAQFSLWKGKTKWTISNVAIHLTEICCLYYGKIPMKMILCILWIGLIWGFDSAVCMGIAHLHSISIPALLADPLSCTITGLVSKLSLLTSTAIVKQLHPCSRNISVRWPYFFLLLPFPIASVASMVILWESRNAAVISQRPITICLFLLTAACIAVLILLDRLEVQAQEHEELAILQRQTEIQLESIQSLRDSYAAQRATVHDFNRHLSMLHELLYAKKTQEAEAYISQISCTVPTRIMAVKTGHPLVDTLFSRKYIIADEKGIDMDFTVNDLTDLAMENGHLVVLLSNLMDNAIEACERVESGREVRVSFLLQDNEVFLSVRNTSLPVQITDGGIVSSKSDGLEHGYGLQNIRYILSLYDAIPVIEYTDGWFQFACEFRNMPIS